MAAPILTVPNWSFGRSRILLRKFDAILEDSKVVRHYLAADIDHNRTVSAFSGSPGAVLDCLRRLTAEAFDAIDLSRHMGVHPRIGALDVCPFVAIGETPEEMEASQMGCQFAANTFAEEVAGQYQVPVFLYEQSARTGRESQLPALRKGGFGGLIDKEINPDFGPTRAHRQLGVSVVGVRPFLIAMNIDLKESSPRMARQIARQIREKRIEGDPQFTGVRALGLMLTSRKMSQVSLNLTLPDLTPIDPIVDYVRNAAERKHVQFVRTELIGVIRRKDLEHGMTLFPAKSQIVEAR